MDSDDDNDNFPSENSDNETDSENDADEHYVFLDPESGESQQVVRAVVLVWDGLDHPAEQKCDGPTDTPTFTVAYSQTRMD